MRRDRVFSRKTPRIKDLIQEKLAMAQWEGRQHVRTILAVLWIVCLSGVLSGCGRPVHVWEAHAYATPPPPSLDISALGREPILALLPTTYHQLQGHIPMVAHALA